MLTTCCFMRLRTAGLVIGGLQAVGSVLSAVREIIGLIALNKIKKEHKTNDDSAFQFIYAAVVIFLLMSLINLLTSILLIVGTLKDRHKLLLPWLIIGTISFILCALYFGGTVVAVFSNAHYLLNVLFLGLGLALQSYCLYAIYSLYKEIESKNNAMHHMPGSMQTNFSQI